MVALTLEFGGGLELLFGGEKVHQVEVPPQSTDKKLDLGALLGWVRAHLLQERPEMFLKDKSVRPGILVLINDTDWELCGKLDTELEDGDTVVFISTLHGG